MKINVLWVVVAMVAGFVLGGWGLRTDLRKAKEDITKLQAGSDKQVKRSTELEGIRTLLKIPENQVQDNNLRPEHARRHALADTNLTTLAQSGASNITLSATSSNTPAGSHKSMGDGIKQAAELWKTRSALARNSFVSNVALNKDQEAKFDVLLDAMNLRLGERMEKWADYIKTKGELNPEDGIRMINDLSTPLVLTYNELDSNMPQGWREKAGENFQLVNHIDPEVVKPLVEVEDILNKAGQHTMNTGAPPLPPAPEGPKTTVTVGFGK